MFCNGRYRKNKYDDINNHADQEDSKKNKLKCYFFSLHLYNYFFFLQFFVIVDVLRIDNLTSLSELLYMGLFESITVKCIVSTWKHEFCQGQFKVKQGPIQHKPWSIQTV